MDPTFSSRYYESAQAGHWWFNGRAAFVRTLLSKIRIHEGLIGDLGAGSSSLFPNSFDVVGFDSAIPDKRLSAFIQSDVRSLPIRDDCFRGVGLFDVLEHVHNPRVLLTEARRVVMPGGFLLVTVPAHQWLWSSHDELAGHVRRYEKKQLIEELHEAGWRVNWCGEFYGFLLPGAILRRLPWFNPSFEYPRAGVNALLTKLAVRSATRSVNNVRQVGLSLGSVAFKG